MSKETEKKEVKKEEPTMAQRCLIPISTADGGTVGIVEKGKSGYRETTYKFAAYKDAQRFANQFNRKAGLKPEQVSDMLLDSMTAPPTDG